MATDVTDFYREAFQMIRANWFSFVLLAMPLLFYILYMRRYAAKRRSALPKLGVQGGTVLFVYVLAVVVVSLNRTPEHFSDYDYYGKGKKSTDKVFVILREKIGNHRGWIQNQAMSDGYCKTVKNAR